MGKELLVRMEIPISPEIIFTKWLPLREEDFIRIESDDLTIKYWFNLNSVEGPGAEEIEFFELTNIGVDKIFVDVTIRGQQDELVKWILNRPPSGIISPDQNLHSEQIGLQSEYEILAERVYLTVLRYLNRLLDYVRVQAGQFWLEKQPIRTSVLLSEYRKFKAKVQEGESEWTSWYSTERPQVVHLPRLYFDRYLNQEKWIEAGEFVRSLERSDLVEELLSSADLLSEMGHSRSALTEATTALEVAINQFAENSNIKDQFSYHLANRLNLKSIKSQVDHMGLSGTIGYLIPVLFTEEQISNDLLRVCQEAIRVRNTVVHHGQRQIDEEKLTRYLASIRSMCNILKGLPQKPYS